MLRQCKRSGNTAYIPDNIKVNPIMQDLCLDCIAQMIEEGRDKRARV